MKKSFFILFVLACVLLIFACSLSEARGGRGGGGSRGGGGGSRGGGRIGGGRISGSRSSRSYRSSYRWSYRSSYRSSYRRTRLSGPNWKIAFFAGHIYGTQAYRTRRTYILYPHRAPTICLNSHDYRINGTRSMEFVCPLESQKDDYDYCCGSNGYQKCCRYFDDSGRLAGVVIGVLIFVALVVGCVFIYCYCCKRKKPKQKKKRTVVEKTTTVSYSAHGPTPIQTHIMPSSGEYDANAASGLPYSTPNGAMSDQSHTNDANAASGLPYSIHDDGVKYAMPQTDQSMGHGYAPYPSQPIADQPYPEQPYPANPIGPLDTGYQPQPMGPPSGYPPQPYPLLGVPPSDGIPYPPAGVPPSDGIPYPPKNPDGSPPYPPAQPPAYHTLD